MPLKVSRWPSFQLVVFGLLALCLTGCAALPTSPVLVPSRDSLADFSLEGRFSLRHEEKNSSGRLSWRHVGMNDEVLLSSPFGQGLAEIVSNERGARLTLSDGKVYEAADAETLTRRVLGFPIPLAQLTDWVRGRAGAGKAERDAFGRLTHLHHEAWQIDYEYENTEAQAPPIRLVAINAGGIDLRLRIDEWRSLAPGEIEP
ncbi:MAG: lipoprotein insertase outer membrane protein LolB [Betaproteobacteria bacterium]